jgi:hypothetical protein
VTSAFGEWAIGVTVTVPFAFLYLPVPAFSGIDETPLLARVAVTSFPRRSDPPTANSRSEPKETLLQSVARLT